MQEVKLRQMLWDSTQEWEKSIHDWHELSFNSLDVEDLSNVTNKIIKNCTLLEKNLPKNKIVPQLRYDAEQFKEKLPVIQYLRNPALKTVST